MRSWRVMLLCSALVACDEDLEGASEPPMPPVERRADAAAAARDRIDAATPRAAGDARVDVTPLDASAPHDAGRDEGLTCYPLLAHAGDFHGKYKPGIARDAYTAFTWAAPWKETSYAVLFRPVLDNKRVVHHWLLFEDDAPGGKPGPGYVQPGLHPDSLLIAAWVPGQDPIDLRVPGHDVGLELRADTTYTLEVHYNSDDEGAEDASGVEVCTVDRKPANIASYSWLGWENLTFPSDHWTGVCNPNYAQGPIHVISIVPHMHLKGRHAKVTVQRADGGAEILHDAPFDFAYERLYQTDLTLYPGDSVRTDCSYSEPKLYGPQVEEEMCYVFTMAYPRGALTSADFVGSLIHGGGTCFGQ